MYVVQIDTGVYSVTVDSRSMECNLSEETTSTPTFTFTVYSNSPVYDNVLPGHTLVTVYDTVLLKFVFFGEVYSIEEDESDGTLSKEITCEGGRAFLRHQPMMECYYIRYPAPHSASMPLVAFVSAILSAYNTYLSPSDPRRIYMDPTYAAQGIAMYDVMLPGDILVLFDFATTDCLDALSQLFSYCGVEWQVVWDISTYGGFADNCRLLLQAEYALGKVSENTLVIGQNLMSVTKTASAEELYTRIYPLGGVCSWHDRNGTYHENERFYLKDLYMLNRSSDDEYYTAEMQSHNAIYLMNPLLESFYPIKAKTVVYDDIVYNDEYYPQDTSWSGYNNVVRELEAACRSDVEQLQNIVEEFTITAADLAKAGYDIDELKIFEIYRVVDPLIGMDEYFKCTAKNSSSENRATSTASFGQIRPSQIKLTTAIPKNQSENGNILQTINNINNTVNSKLGDSQLKFMTRSDYTAVSSKDNSTVYNVTDTDGYITMYKGTTPYKASNSEKVNGLSVVVLTQSEYDAITNPDEDTIYIIEG